MERENNLKDRPEDEAPKFGAGSEFGREAREEARRKKYGAANKNYKPDNQPWQLRVGGKTGKRYKGVRGGGITENASYYVFMKAADGAFEAFPVEEWYNFTPVQRYKFLSAEEAEEEFGRREKVMNYFSIMLKKRLTLDDKSGEPVEGEEKTQEGKKGGKGANKGGKNELRITDMDEWLSDSENEDDSDESGGEGKKKKKSDGEDQDGKDGQNSKKKKNLKGKAAAAAAKKKKKSKGSDEEALEESDEGDFDDREVDYMSDSSTSSEEAPEDKMSKQMKGVEDEEALMKLNVSDEDEEEAEQPNPEEAKKDVPSEENTPTGEEKKLDTKSAKGKVDKKSAPTSITNKASSGDSSPESSDSDFDDSKFQSAMFMQKAKKRGGSDNSAGSSRANTPTRPNGS